MSSASLLQLLATQARLSDGELAERLDMTEEAVRAQREQWEKEGVILGYQAVVNEEYEHDSKVAAFIEVKMTPERDGGFDRLAMRISRFDEVSSCY
ncbi:Lrp/AsnC family transcriptional regulator, partial [Escherichia coli]|nr:Lrp/AsnC family transcriptional regulator [Escherichia coli]